ncbi:MAG TPA: hypothetical protein DIT01_19060 [Lentisphaeria bacterium]|nr:hypothetical protein [Lentisphaeria bacterium]
MGIQASAFNITINSDDANSPWLVSDGGAWVAGPWAPWDYAPSKTADVPVGSYGWFGKWAHFANAVTFDVDGSGNIQNIQPTWGGNGEGTNTLNITPPQVHYGFAGSGTSLVGLVHKWPGGVTMGGWVGDGDHAATAMWPQNGGEAGGLWRHFQGPGNHGDVMYVRFTMDENGKIVDPYPETHGTFSVAADGRAETDTAGTSVDVGSAYVMTDPALVDEVAGIDYTSYRLDALQEALDNIQLTPGPQGPQGKAGSAGSVGAAGANGADGGQGPQGKQGDTGAAAPCIDCETLSVATFDLACALLLANPPSTVSDFQGSVDAIATVAIVGSGGNICDPIPGAFATCMGYINDQVQAIYDSKATE